MYWAVYSGSFECVKVLYGKGYEQHCSISSHEHPAVNAVWLGRREILRFVVDRNGPLTAEVELLCHRAVAQGGVESLRCARELRCVFDAGTTELAAEVGSLEALRYFHMAGTPWNCRTLHAAVWADSLPCLEYAHMHGCPKQDEDEADFMYVTDFAKSLPVLRYVCEHMDPAFAAKKLEATAIRLK
jgi:hypothetical protein